MKSFNFSKDTAAIFDAKARAIRAYNLMQWARWATFGLYIVAVFMLYVSDVWGIASYLEKNSNEYIALGVFSITSFALSYFLASSKEAVYEDIALNRSEGFHMTWGQRFAMTLFASAGILFELFSATSNQQHISNNAAEQAGLLKPAVVGSVAINTPPALAETLMKAQANLNNCGELLKQGRVKDCQFSQGKVTGAERAIQMANETAVTINGDMVDKTNAHNEKLLERFDKPMFKVVGKAVGGDTHDGMLVAVAVMITIFELQHILAVFAYGNALRRMNADKLAKRPEDETRPAAQALPGSAFNSAKQTVNDYATKAAESIATENAKAQYARANTYNVAGDALDNAGLKLSGGFKQSPEQRQNALNLASMSNPASALVSANADKPVSGSTYREELRNGSQRFEDMPLDQLTKPAATLPHDQRNGATGAHNPALGTQEEQHALPLSNVRVHSQEADVHSPDTYIQTDVRAHSPANVRGNSELLAAMKDAQGKIEPDTLKEAYGLYDQWKVALLAGEKVLAARGGRAFITRHLCQARKKTITPSGMDALLNLWRKRAGREGVIVANPKYTGNPPHPEYLLVGN